MEKYNGDLKTTIDTYDQVAIDYAKRQQQLSRGWDRETQKNLVHFAQYFHLGAKVLDLGCGPGHDTYKFNQLGYKALGLDISKGMLREAKTRYPFCKFILSDIRKLSLQSGSFDGIWMSASFLHIPRNEGQQTLEEVKRVIRNRGYLYLSLKSGKGKITTYNLGKRIFELYSNDEVRHLAKLVGFDIIEEWCFEENIKWIMMICGNP